jgi:hypothetical protein
MSKLAPVTTGQPAQGIGTAPNGKQLHASPLQAQKAEAEASGALVIDDLAAPDPSLPANSPRNHYAAQRHAAAAAWLSLTATDLEIRKYFRELPSVQSGLETLAKMRHQCDLAAESLQARMDEGNTERCTGCGKTLEEARKTQWIMSGAEVDPGTGVPMPYRFCGVLCVRERNREKMLPPEQRKDKRADGQEFGDVL